MIYHEKSFLSYGRQYVGGRLAAHIALRFWIYKRKFFDLPQHGLGDCINPGEHEDSV